MNANPYVKTGDPQTWFRMATPRALEIFGNAYEYAMNTGVLFMRTSPATIAFATEWHEVMRQGFPLYPTVMQHSLGFHPSSRFQNKGEK